MFESKKNIETWVECGDDYYYGKNGEKVDYEMAVHFYEKAMKKKHPRATYMMGLCYELGRYVEKDLAHAEILYSTAAGYGDPDAKKRLKNGRQAEPAVPIAERREAEQRGASEKAQNKAIFNKDDWVQQLLQAREEGKRYAVEQRETKEKSYNKAVQDLERGLAYLNEGDCLNANESLSDAAEAGNTKAMVKLALMLISDMGEWNQDMQSIYRSRWPNTDNPAAREGFAWLDKAAELGEPDAIAEKKSLHAHKEAADDLERGLMYYKKRKYTEAAEYIMKAAEAGNAEARVKLSLMYKKGEGVRQDFAKSDYWVEKAAEAGDADSIAAVEKDRASLKAWELRQAQKKAWEEANPEEAERNRQASARQHRAYQESLVREREAAEQRRRQRAQSSSGSGPRGDLSAKQNAENAEAARRAQKSREEAARLAQRSKEWHENH